MRSRRSFLDYLRDIQEATEAALSFVDEQDLAAFLADNKTHFAIVRALEIVGEAAHHIPSEVRTRWPQIPWQDMADMRNVLAHAYSGVNLETVWQTVQRDLPSLRDAISQVLAELDEPARG